MARLPSSVLNTAAFTYLGFRAAFVVLYINGTTSKSLFLIQHPRSFKRDVDDG
jgi:uncharacterized MAPEG superfamily protein